jgi:porphobilinogen deaminase
MNASTMLSNCGRNRPIVSIIRSSFLVFGILTNAALAAQADLPQAKTIGPHKLQQTRAKQTTEVPSYTIRRSANMQDGAPSFEILNQQGKLTTRVECIQNGYVDVNPFSARFMASPTVMANIIAKEGRITLDDLGPAGFDCVIAAITN